MDGIVKILRRFVGTTIFISLFLLIANFVLLGTLVFKELHQGASPESVVKQAASELQVQDNNYTLTESGMNLLEQHQAWAMLLNTNGDVQWSYQLPQEIPHSYDIIDIAKLSRYYLMEYPVYIWEHSNGLVVVGYPKHSYSKYQFDFLVDWISTLPLRLLLLLICNVALAVFISILIGTLLFKRITPLIHGVHELAQDKAVHIDSKGIFNDLAQSINSTSQLLQDKTESLKIRDEARSNWIAGISHDIRTPLSMILGYASDIEENRELSLELRQQAGIITRQSEKLKSLVSDLNLVSMLEYDMQPLHMRPLRLNALARSVASEFLNNGLAEKYVLNLNLLNEPMQVQGDEKLLSRAIGNLIQNSIIHNPNGCTIELTTAISSTKEQDMCKLIVLDNGKGISRDMLSEITKLPYSSDRKHQHLLGHGLGLPMVARIARAHHGQLRLQSNDSDGRGHDPNHSQGLTAILEFPTYLPKATL